MKHWALYLGTIWSNMKFQIETLPTPNKIVRLPKDECDNLSEKELGEKLTEACKGILTRERNLSLNFPINVL